jgi:hypothetical protein
MPSGGGFERDRPHARANQDVKGMLNLPINDTLAVRLNASWTIEAGFINQPNLYVLDSSGAPVGAARQCCQSRADLFEGRHQRLPVPHRAHRRPVEAERRVQGAVERTTTRYSTGRGLPAGISPLYGLNALSSSDHTQATTDDKSICSR